MVARSTPSNSTIDIIDYAKDNNIHDGELVFNQVVNAIGEDLVVEAREIKAKNFSFHQTCMRLKADQEHCYQLAGDVIVMYFVMNGSVNFTEKGKIATLNPGEVRLVNIARSAESGTLHFKGRQNFERFFFIMERDFFRSLIEKEGWSKEHSLCQLFYEEQSPKNTQATIIPFNFQIHSVLLDIMNVQHLSHNQFDYIRIKIKELFILLNPGEDFCSRSALVVHSPIEHIKGYVLQNIYRPLTITSIAQHFNISESKLKKDFKIHTNDTLHRFIVESKLEVAQRLITQDVNVSELAHRLGFQSISHFIKIFKKHYHFTPGEYAKRFKV